MFPDDGGIASATTAPPRNTLCPEGWTSPAWEASVSETDVEGCPDVLSHPAWYLWKAPELSPTLISEWLARNLLEG